MESINATSLFSPQQPSTGSARNGIAEMDSDDFLKLMVVELTNQDPLEPTGNEELLRQISTIRDIEMSTNLTESLQKLAGQRNYGSSSSLIGQFVTGISASSGMLDRGMVVGIRFNETGSPTLVLSNGVQLSLDEVSSIESPQHAAQALIGKNIVGVDRRDATDPQRVEGVVTSVRTNERGEVVLELDSGQDLLLADVFGTITASAA